MNLPCIETDGVQYVGIAEELYEDHTLTNKFYPPGFPFFITLVSYVIHDYELSARVVSAICGALLIIPAVLICLDIYGRRTAVGLALLILCYPPLVEYSTRVSTESTFSLFFMWFVYASMRALASERTQYYFLTGVCLGILYLIRPEGIGFLAYFVAAYIVLRLKTDSVATYRLFRNILCVVSASMIIALPYMLFVGGISGKTQYQLSVWSKTVGNANVIRAHDELAWGDEPSEPTSLGQEFIRHPGMMIKRFAMNLHLVHKYVIPTLLFPVILVMIGLGLFRIHMTWKESYLYLIWLPFTVILFMIVDARFFLPLVPILLIVAVRGIGTLSELISKRFRLSHFSGVLTAVFVLVLLSLLPFTFRPTYRPDDNRVYREAGIWLKEHLASAPKIIDRKPFVAYYSEGVPLGMPIGGIEDIVAYARVTDATHLVIDNKVIPEVRPELTPLLSTSYVSEDVTLLKAFDAHGRSLMLYQFR